MIGRILIGASLGVSCLLGASGAMAMAWEDQNARAQAYGNPSYYGQTYNGYGENPAFTQGCPVGSIPESFPGGNGRRCALRGGGYIY